MTSSESRKVFRNVLRRSPRANEQQNALKHVQAIDGKLASTVDDAKLRRKKCWASLCQALLSCNEFRYID